MRHLSKAKALDSNNNVKSARRISEAMIGNQECKAHLARIIKAADTPHNLDISYTDFDSGVAISL